MKASVANLEQSRRQLPLLVKQAQQGDSNAFEQIVQLTERLARRIAVSVVPESLVEDVLQESYLLVYRKLVVLRKPESFISWFSRLVLHTSYNMVRGRKYDCELDQEVSVPDQTEDLVEQEALKKALFQLEQKDRNILILREMLELSYEQIATALRLKTGTVRSRLHKARKHLLERLGAGQQGGAN
ncbi:MAG: sigma-70 family RNA polymerase sigma factor [Vulcanimicrobiota bacterium]